MSRTRAWPKETLEIQRRFFDTVDELVSAKQVPGGLAGYCQLGNIDRRNYYTQRRDMSRGYFDISWALPLIRDFDVLPTWLLFGLGRKYKASTPAVTA